MTGRPYGLRPEPLLELIERRAMESGLERRGFMRLHFGATGDRYYWRWLAGGGVSVNVADRYACALGVHPGDLWPEWWDVECPEDDHGTLVAYRDGCTCLACLRAGLDALTQRMWEMSPLSVEELEELHGQADERPGLTLIEGGRAA